jgi:hypothetical protein
LSGADPAAPETAMAATERITMMIQHVAAERQVSRLRRRFEALGSTCTGGCVTMKIPIGR